ncbi:hypothetical protein TREMEDRAFT_66087 [Tremella mesenterica DSM 1558]|uniref:uncharacterized protein n=1 Tax=Tremella mesenterica (strain ATCC 24925 / CBS 8224 / DSM 1558 / NBRC 9311 / NRRL Y-6157 / RJB 2259-6 / UBC 559-6) TaxID=578456 RepID=UPI00032C4AF2|nr:uncharacterized protein TREMEDRAFT_66087 [Tremella mesenterica DSM 1558]EIW65994.1 hypothetical protein TREMEDRAFT_66087 [Tremella mesenterica DSM 1558]
MSLSIIFASGLSDSKKVERIAAMTRRLCDPIISKVDTDASTAIGPVVEASTPRLVDPRRVVKENCIHETLQHGNKGMAREATRIGYVHSGKLLAPYVVTPYATPTTLAPASDPSTAHEEQSVPDFTLINGDFTNADDNHTQRSNLLQTIVDGPRDVRDNLRDRLGKLIRMLNSPSSS